MTSQRKTISFWNMFLAATAISIAVTTLVLLAQRELDVSLPLPDGPYPVARTELPVIDRSRLDPLARSSVTPRILAAFVWYPTIGPGKEAAYAPGLWRGTMAGSGTFAPEARDPDRIHIAVVEGGAAATGSFPLVIFEPGYGHTAIDYSAFLAMLASYGYVIVAITPTYSVERSIVGGRIISGTRAGRPDESNEKTFLSSLRRNVLPQWKADFESVFEAVVANRSAPWVRSVDYKQVHLMGHSLGGAAAFQACPPKPWCLDAIDLDGATFDATESSKPRMLVGYSGSRAELTTLQRIYFSSPVTAPHLAVSDLPWTMTPMFARLIMPQQAPERTLRRIAHTAENFLRRNLMADAEPGRHLIESPMK